LSQPKYSLISPTFGRPEEVTEFLESLLQQNHHSFEVVLGDGTPKDTLRPWLKKFENNPIYPFTVVYKEFLPVSDARNEAARVAKGEYFIFLDSDCIIPTNYLNQIDEALATQNLDLFGGPDIAHESFTPLQKAINYAMTAMLTTGGIRGKKKALAVYHPRGFNMGIRRAAFEKVGGYSTDFKCGEDVELSIRIIDAGFKSGFLPNAAVYHKRRTSLQKFYKQVYRFGAARVNLWFRHQRQLKAAHIFPVVFLVFFVLAILLLFVGQPLLFSGFVIYALAVFIDSLVLTKNIKVAALSVVCAFAMHIGYGYGFLQNFISRVIFRNSQGIKI